MNPLDPKTTLTISTAVVLALALLSLIGIAFWAPDESRATMLAADGVISSVILAAMRSLWARDAAKLLPIVFVLLTSSSTLACGSSAGAALAGQSTPQSLGFRIHASEGSTIIIGGAYECRELEPPAEGETRSPHRCEPREGQGASVQFWLDGRSGGASTDQEISGPNISTLLKLLAQVPVSTGGSASTGGQSSEDADDAAPPGR